MSEEDRRFCDPVTIPGVPGVFERAVILQKIKGKMAHGLRNSSPQNQTLIFFPYTCQAIYQSRLHWCEFWKHVHVGTILSTKVHHITAQTSHLLVDRRLVLETGRI